MLGCLLDVMRLWTLGSSHGAFRVIVPRQRVSARHDDVFRFRRIPPLGAPLAVHPLRTIIRGASAVSIALYRAARPATAGYDSGNGAMPSAVKRPSCLRRNACTPRRAGSVSPMSRTYRYRPSALKSSSRSPKPFSVRPATACRSVMLPSASTE